MEACERPQGCEHGQGSEEEDEEPLDGGDHGGTDAHAARTGSTAAGSSGAAARVALEELLQQRAQAAIEGAKHRNAERENRRISDVYVHRLIRKLVYKLNWVKVPSWERAAPPARQGGAGSLGGRRRDRKKDLRGRWPMPEYEEVPGGGQFLMMLLGRNKGPSDPAQQQRRGPSGEGAAGDGPTGEEGSRTVPGHRRALGQGETPGIHDDPAILRVEAAPPQVDKPGIHGDPAVLRVEAAQPRPEPRAQRWQRRPPPKGGSPAQAGEQILLESLLPRSLLPAPAPGEVAEGEVASLASLPLPQPSQPSQAPMPPQPSSPSAPAPSPLIPPMPGFSAIWGTPASRPPTASPAGDPWAPAPRLLLGAPAGDSAGALDASSRTPPRNQPPGLGPPLPGHQRAQAEAAQPARAQVAQPRGRRGGRNRDRRGERVQDLDLWDMPGRPTGTGDRQCDLPEFFRDSWAPPFRDHVLEDRPKAASENNGPGRVDADPLAGVAAEGRAWLPSAIEDDDDDEDDEIVFQAPFLE